MHSPFRYIKKQPIYHRITAHTLKGHLFHALHTFFMEIVTLHHSLIQSITIKALSAMPS